MKETRIKGLFQGGRLLYGYKLEGRKVVINENEAEIVKMFFNKYNAGIYVPDIIDELNKKNISNRGKRWLKSTVYNMLANEKYTGKYTCNGEIVDNIYPQIIGEDLFEVTKAKKRPQSFRLWSKLVGLSGLGPPPHLIRYFRYFSVKHLPYKCLFFQCL